MKRLLTLSILLPGISCLLYSCDTCNDSNQIVDQHAIEITAFSDSVNLNSGSNSSIELKGITKNREMDKKCSQKNLVLVYGEKIKSTDIRITCDKPLIYGPGTPNTIPPGTNILDYTDRVDLKYNYLYASTDNVSSGSVIINADLSKGFKPGTYIFTIKGKTNQENTFLDTTCITYYQ